MNPLEAATELFSRENPHQGRGEAPDQVPARLTIHTSETLKPEFDENTFCGMLFNSASRTQQGVQLKGERTFHRYKAVLTTSPTKMGVGARGES